MNADDAVLRGTSRHDRRYGGDPVLDDDVLEALWELGDDGPDFALELIDLFLADAGGRIEDMVTASAAGDLQGVGNVAHALKSASANVGALPFAHACKRIEHEARARSSEAVRLLVDLSVGMYSEVRAALLDLRERWAD